MQPTPFTYFQGQPQPIDPSSHPVFSSGPDMSGLFALFIVFAIVMSIGGLVLRLRYGVPMRRYGYGMGYGWRPWGGPPFPPYPVQPPLDPYIHNPADPFGPQVGMQAPMPGCDPQPFPGGGFDAGPSGGISSCDPGSAPGFSGSDPGGGTAGSIPS